GRASAFWQLFDFKLAAGEKIRLPVLGGSLDEALESGLLKTEQRNGKAALTYGGRWFPLRPESADLKDQHYELVNWKDVFARVSYRRFFDIADLICLRVEDEENFALVHKKLFALLGELPSVAGV